MPYARRRVAERRRFHCRRASALMPPRQRGAGEICDSMRAAVAYARDF